MMASSVNIPPHKIVLCVAYPYEITDFQRCFQTGKSDFIASMNLSHLSMEEAWRQYDIDRAAGIRQCIEELKSRNVDVIPLYDVNDISSAVGYDVVIVLAHHVEENDSIELLNGPVPTSVFAASFIWVEDSIVDISSCFSMTFRQLQERFFPACQILEINAEPSFSLRLLLIQETIERLAHDSSRGYVDTLLDVYVDSLNLSKEDIFRQDHTHKTYFNNVDDALDSINNYLFEENRNIYFVDWLLYSVNFSALFQECINIQKERVRGAKYAKIPDDDEVEDSTLHKEIFPSLSRESISPGFSWDDNDWRESPEVKSILDNLLSSVFAPGRVNPGDTFIVQLFFYKQEDSSEVEIMASALDMETGIRNSKRLSVPLKIGDTIRVRLEAVFDKKNEFEIDESDKEIVWNDEPVSVEYVVSVKETCTCNAFNGRFRIRVNSLPICVIIFKVDVIDEEHACAPRGDGKASYELIPYDKMKEAKEAADLMEKRISDNIQNLESYKSNHSDPREVERANKELAINRHCLELIKNDRNKKSPVKVVFISSTSDLKESRETVRKVIEKSHMYPEMYENWPQGNVYPRDKCIEKVLSSDIFICILGANYGKVEHMWNMSMTEIEYRAALLSGKNILVYIDRQYESKMSSLENKDHNERQLELIKELSDKRWVKFFDDQASLEREVQGDLSEMIKDMDNGFSASGILICSQEYRTDYHPGT